MTTANSAFRLSLPQQRKRAKELLSALKVGDAAALARLAASGHYVPAQHAKLADAQRVIAHELGFRAWSQLKSHIDALDRAGSAIQRQPPPDADVPTLHVRCGSDIQQTLQAAGFTGEFLEVSYPYCHGPVSAAADHLHLEARFIAEFTRPSSGISFENALRRRQQEEAALLASASGSRRIVLWMEHDCYDQLVLLRCLATYASARPPASLELISIDHFPGTTRFIGLGQLPAAALRLLWERRRAVSVEQLTLATRTFAALQLEDPRPLAALVRHGTLALPFLAGALRRLLQELPWLADGLSLTERMILQRLAQSQARLSPLLRWLNYERDPLPFATDLWLWQVLKHLCELAAPPIIASIGDEDWTQQQLQITPLGHALLRGECDLASLGLRNRWVGGVHVGCAQGWRWNEAASDVVWR